MPTRCALSLLCLTALFAAQPTARQETAFTGPIRLAFLCLLKDEQKSGQNKLCLYDCPVGDAAITVKAWERCPLSVDQ